MTINLEKVMTMNSEKNHQQPKHNFIENDEINCCPDSCCDESVSLAVTADEPCCPTGCSDDSPAGIQAISGDAIRDAVREQYAAVASSGSNSCCNAENRANVRGAGEISKQLGYSEADVLAVPEGANMGLGCGNPQTIAGLKLGESVLDLGSGAGFDCFLAAESVGVTGKVIGVDMTPEMITKARNNTNKTGFNNVDFRLGEIENLPLADGRVDVIISNCVINLSPNKKQVFQEAFRVLKSGGRIAISDVVAVGELTEQMKSNMALVSGCVSGTSTVEEITLWLKQAGFTDISIKSKDESREFINNWSSDSQTDDLVVAANIEATKPNNT